MKNAYFDYIFPGLLFLFFELPEFTLIRLARFAFMSISPLTVLHFRTNEETIIVYIEEITEMTLESSERHSNSEIIHFYTFE